MAKNNQHRGRAAGAMQGAFERLLATEDSFRAGTEAVLRRVFWDAEREVSVKPAEVWRLPLPGHRPLRGR